MRQQQKKRWGRRKGGRAVAVTASLLPTRAISKLKLTFELSEAAASYVHF